MTLKRRSLLFYFCLAALLSGGCSTIDHFYTLHYKKLALSHAELVRDGVAVLPMASLYEEAEYRKSAQEIFLRSLKGLQKDFDLIEPFQAAKLATEAGVYDSFSQLTGSNLQKEVPRLLLVRKVGRAMGKRFLMRPELVNTRVTEGATQLTLRAQIWDVEAGEVVWEASEETRGYVNLVFPQTPAPLEKVMEVAAINLIKKMP
ncbi:MAG: hypothetical protein HY036_05920 [Nitrospirae bacterium]|nr:hypothetical protein [Nitrospirota bacterium]MBI3352098.1 hypothetical protein [Nitrospirota bacterium]